MKNQQEKTERLLAEALPAGIINLNSAGQIIWWNHSAGNMLKLEQQHIHAQISTVFSSKAFLEFYQNAGGQELKLESPVIKEDYLTVKIRPYVNGQKIMIIHDVTRTERLLAMRQDFIANVSHELRTPLTVFSGYLELLLEHERLDNAQFKTMLKHMREQSERMETLVRDLLLLSRLESDQPDARRHAKVEVCELLHMIAKDAKSLSGDMQHKIYLELDPNIEMYGHEEELRSAFSNIVFNAIRYTPKQGTIKIKWYRDAKGKHLEVTDNGIGIEEKHISRITQRFYRVDKSRTYQGKGGTGLGLAIVKHVLLRHKGELSITSKINEGSTFICTFS